MKNPRSKKEMIEKKNLFDKKLRFKIESYLSQKQNKGIELFSIKRELVGEASKAIKEMHQGKYHLAKKRIQKISRRLRILYKRYPDFENQLYIIAQEYTEASCLYSLIKRGKVPSFEELCVPPEPYLTGLFDLIGELNRMMFDNIIRGKRELARLNFVYMNEIYDFLSYFNFMDFVLPNFRRKQDVARIQIERAREKYLSIILKGC